MRIAVSGWGRDMGQTTIGNFALDTASIEYNTWPWDKPAASIEQDTITIKWGSSIKLTGDYRVRAEFSINDVVFLFKQYYGHTITNEILAECNFDISDDVLQKHLGEMTLDRLFDLLWYSKDRPARGQRKLLSRKVEDLDLSIRSAICLKNDNIIYIGDLVQKTEAEMLRTENFGRKSLNEIKAALKEMGLDLGMEISGWQSEGVD